MSRLANQHIFFANGIVLLVVGIAGFIANNYVMHTGLTPVISGFTFILLSILLKNGLNYFTKPAMIFAILLAIAFFWPLLRNIEQSDIWGMTRIGIEISSCLITGYFVYKNIRA
ncbi:MAG: hypothetical protein IPM34_04285 [Saprospiraceae bacterium]|nr:hypothetical protein [Saprospiraceae bacterium]